MLKQRTQAAALLAAGVVGGGILAGTLGAHAADQSDDPAGPGPVRMHRPGGFGGPRDGADLAKALGVSQSDLRSALKAVRDDLKPAKRPDGPPSAARRKAMEEKFAAALAKELGIDKSTVTAALEKVRSEHEADHRAHLSDRLDDAVKAGTLTSDDKASVLKAFDAGVLGGPGANRP